MNISVTPLSSSSDPHIGLWREGETGRVRDRADGPRQVVREPDGTRRDRHQKDKPVLKLGTVGLVLIRRVYVPMYVCGVGGLKEGVMMRETMDQ